MSQSFAEGGLPVARSARKLLPPLIAGGALLLLGFGVVWAAGRGAGEPPQPPAVVAPHGVAPHEMSVTAPPPPPLQAAVAE